MIEQASGFLVFALFGGLLWARPYLAGALARAMPPKPSSLPGLRCRSNEAARRVPGAGTDGRRSELEE